MPPRTDDPAPAEGAPDDRWRAEVLVDDKPRTVTSHVWIRRPPPVVDEGCECGASPPRGFDPWWLIVGLLIVRYTRVRRRL